MKRCRVRHRVHAIEALQEVDVPPVPAELAVGRRLQADRFLLRDCVADAAVLDFAQRGAVDLSALGCRTGLAQLLRPQQAPDVIGVKGRLGHRGASPGHCSEAV
jgi:hypothetical protein